jgi:UDPglucose 6-dehydrogenase
LGSVTAACLASVRHQVLGLDSDTSIIKSLNEGKAPLFEPGLDLLITDGIKDGALEVTTDGASAGY